LQLFRAHFSFGKILEIPAKKKTFGQLSTLKEDDD
jgi:hypothetical protein